MKKSKLLVLGLVGLLLAGGLVLVGCDLFSKCPGGYNPLLGSSYGAGSKGNCNYSGTQSSMRDCEDGCLVNYASRNPNAYSFSCDC